MRNYLQDINIIGAVMVYRCLDIHEYSIKDLVEHCDKVIIMLDNYDEHAEKKVFEYQAKYPKIEIFYSNFPKLENEDISGASYRRFLKNQGPIRHQIIEKLHEMNKKEKIDLVIWLDSDECFNQDMPKYLTHFWESGQSIMSTGFVTVINNFKTLIHPSMPNEARIYKYRTDMSCFKYGKKGFCAPYTRADRARYSYPVVHCCFLNKKSRDSKSFHKRRAHTLDKVNTILRDKKCIHVLDKDVRKMASDDIRKKIKGKPDYTLGEYLDKFNIDY